ncbi:hypothetical protein J1N35_008496 [Gossypium stocksii]|uniref:RNase H type-1 domain-containing protein n=1 Tax=Gossypium stocksii TaxID=47602 RepID=A0A9D3W9E2_9ROSI|nr:hypothetical protein J1N35_008496 [Gossypium stocksii]
MRLQENRKLSSFKIVHLVLWRTPPWSIIKINMDGATQFNIGNLVVGSIIRDRNGAWCLEFLFAISGIRISAFLSFSFGGSNKKVMTVLPTGNGVVLSAPKFKRRKVSAIQDFLPGCGRIIAPKCRLSELITIDRSSQGKC